MHKSMNQTELPVIELAAPRTMSTSKKRASASSAGEDCVKRVQRNKEISKLANDRRRKRVQEINKELADTQCIIHSLEQSVNSLREENAYLRNLLENNNTNESTEQTLPPS